jgi:hypothetical protein
MNDKLGRIWKEAVLNLVSKYYHRICLEGLGETTE